MKDVKEITPDEKQENEKEITVELDQNNQPIKEVEKKEEPRYVTAEALEQALKKVTAPLYYELRKSKESYQPRQEPKQEIKKEEPVDEWDKKLQTNWKGTVEELAEQKFQKLMQAEETRRQSEYKAQQASQLLENNKMQVLKKHTELTDETSTKAEVYRQILQERPEYLSNPFGPVLAMRDMEDRLREQGVVDEPTRQIVQKEVVRQARANGGTVPKGSPASGNQKITLSKEQKEFCDQQGIKYENYAKFAKLGNSTEVQ